MSSEGRVSHKESLTRSSADVIVVEAAAVSGDAVFITSAARFLIVKRLITSLPAGREGRDCNRDTTGAESSSINEDKKRQLRKQRELQKQKS